MSSLEGAGAVVTERGPVLPVQGAIPHSNKAFISGKLFPAGCICCLHTMLWSCDRAAKQDRGCSLS